MSDDPLRPGPITLRARHVLPMASPPLEGGWVRIEKGRVAGIGRRRPDGRVIDLGDSIVLPGLVNAHTHLEFSDLDEPLSAAGGLPDWIARVVALRRSRGSAGGEAARLSAAVARGLAESVDVGVTAVGEIATARSPVDGARGPRVRVFHETIGLSAAAMVAARSALLGRLPVTRRPTGGDGISPHAPYSVGMPLGRDVVHEAVGRRLPVAMHLAESPDEAELLATGAGRLRTLLEQLGAWHADAPPRLMQLEDWITLLARARRGLVVHGTFLPDRQEALARLTRHRDRLGVAVCPRTTLRLAGRLPPVAAFRRAGLRISIGTDSRASNPDLSVLAECRTLVDAGVVSPGEALAMATLQGAWSLGFEDRCGRIACGWPADLAIVRPAHAGGDPHASLIDPDSRPVATIRRGRVVSGSLG